MCTRLLSPVFEMIKELNYIESPFCTMVKDDKKFQVNYPTFCISSSGDSSVDYNGWKSCELVIYNRLTSKIETVFLLKIPPGNEVLYFKSERKESIVYELKESPLISEFLEHAKTILQIGLTKNK
jgi:hypothetical protein